MYVTFPTSMHVDFVTITVYICVIFRETAEDPLCAEISMISGMFMESEAGHQAVTQYLCLLTSDPIYHGLKNTWIISNN